MTASQALAVRRHREPARLVVPHDAPAGEWHAARNTGITASRIATVLGISPFDSPFNLHWKMRGTLPEQPDNDVMSLGRHLEPWIADRFAGTHPEWFQLEGGLWANRERPWQMCTPDRQLFTAPVRLDDGCAVDAATGGPEAPVGLLEIKSSGSYDGWGADGTDEIPVYYRAQVQWQLDTLGLTEAHVSCLFLSTRQIRNYTISYDPADVELMRKAALGFLDQVQRGEAPAVDSHHATTTALKALNADLDEDAEVEVPADLDEEYRRVRREFAALEARKTELENQIRQLMGAAKTAVHAGRKVAARSVYDTTGLDRERLRREFPDAWAACRTTTRVDKLCPSRTNKKETSTV